MRTRTSRTIALTLPVVALALGLASCAGGPAPTAKPSAGAVMSEEEFNTIYDAYHVKYASCMREQGADYPDKQPGMAICSDEALKPASDVCMAKLGDPPALEKSKTGTESDVNDQLKRAQCLRDQGYDVPDPKPDGTWGLPENLMEAARACATDG